VSNPNKERGSRWEARLVAFLREQGFPEAVRIRGRGANDEGDLGGFPLWAIEAKDHASIDLPGFVKQAKQEAINSGKPFGIAVIKKRRAAAQDAYVVMDLETWVRLEKYLRAIQEKK
jgi:hypothetical protein